MPVLETAVADLDKWQPDVVVVAGDVVNRGPCSLACWEFVQARAHQQNWRILKGNHEDYVLECATPPNDPRAPSLQIRQYAQWTYEQLNGHIATIAALPDQYSFTAPDGRELRVVHAAMQNNRKRPTPTSKSSSPHPPPFLSPPIPTARCCARLQTRWS